MHGSTWPRQERRFILQKCAKPAYSTPFSLEYAVVLVPTFYPLTFGRAPVPPSRPDYLFEIKWDGFRAGLGRFPYYLPAQPVFILCYENRTLPSELTPERHVRLKL